MRVAMAGATDSSQCSRPLRGSRLSCLALPETRRQGHRTAYRWRTISPSMSDLTLREAQRVVDSWVREQGTSYWHPLAQLARLTEELGETARLINHLHGEKPKRADEPEQDLGLELADILYTMICLANSQGIDLQDSFERALAKYRSRDAGRYTAATSTSLSFHRKDHHGDG